MFTLAIPSSTSVLHASFHRNWPRMPVHPTSYRQAPISTSPEWWLSCPYPAPAGVWVRCSSPLEMPWVRPAAMWWVCYVRQGREICYSPVGWHLQLLCCHPSLSLHHRRKGSYCDCSPHPELFWAVVNWLSYDLYTIATNFLSWLEFLL